MLARAVIGANYGDEGKGRTVDWLTAPHGPAALIVRSNGGAQAAHTVIGPHGERHIFHHLGSGSFHGARTHLSRFMVSHPIIFAKELAQLRALGLTPTVSADPRGLVTTPWDMMVNQAIEMARDHNRHGSCGLGFGETVGRCEREELALTVADLYCADLRAKLLAIREYWLPARLKQLHLAADTSPLDIANADALLDKFIDQCVGFAKHVALRDDAALGEEGMVIFEGAQGLLLDQNAPGFPFLTRSNTGLQNILAIATEAGIPKVDPIYTTRCYLTRHGRGPMEDEREIARWFDVDDPTNCPNPWQESLRFGLLEPERLGRRIRRDFSAASNLGEPSIAITCLDQAITHLAWREGENIAEGSREQFTDILSSKTNLPIEAEFSSPVNDFAANKMYKAF